jgi:hypothetical protein
VTSLASVHLGKSVESTVKVVPLVDVVTSIEGNHINNGQQREAYNFMGRE